jgi:hypothetical protein
MNCTSILNYKVVILCTTERAYALYMLVPADISQKAT